MYKCTVNIHVHVRCVLMHMLYMHMHLGGFCFLESNAGSLSIITCNTIIILSSGDTGTNTRKASLKVLDDVFVLECSKLITSTTLEEYGNSPTSVNCLESYMYSTCAVGLASSPGSTFVSAGHFIFIFSCKSKKLRGAREQGYSKPSSKQCCTCTCKHKYYRQHAGLKLPKKAHRLFCLDFGFLQNRTP